MSSSPNTLDVIDSKVESSDVQQYRRLLAEAQKHSAEFVWQFEVVRGHFKQADPETDETRFNYIKERLGIKHSWQTIVAELDRLNAAADSHTVYKVLLLARHGQGFHNLAHARYGDKLWNEHYSKLNGDGEIVWGPDPLLTELGVSQAVENGDLLSSEVADGAEIVPSKWYVSPLSRSIDTLVHTWKTLVNVDKVGPLIMENLRETTGVHTCDKRSPRSTIEAKYPHFIVEPSLTEADELYQDDYRETVGEISVRMNRAFQFIFGDAAKSDAVVCVTSHSGAIRAQLLALGHRSFAVGTGGIVPVFVRARRSSAPRANHC